MDKAGVRPGVAQRRQRQQMQRRGWRSITTFIRVDHHTLLKQIQNQYNLGALHEALEFVLIRSVLDKNIVNKAQSNGTAGPSGHEPAARPSGTLPCKESAP